MTTYPSAPVDGATQDTLDLLGVDPSKRTDREVVEAAVEDVAAEHGGVIDPNILRDRLKGDDGRPMVRPQIVGSVINALARSKRIVPDGWVITTHSPTGNSGRPARRWRTSSRSPSPKSAAGRRGAVSTRPPLAT